MPVKKDSIVHVFHILVSTFTAPDNKHYCISLSLTLNPPSDPGRIDGISACSGAC